MKIAVIGLGITKKFYKPELFDASITVNDGQRYFKTDYVVCVDYKYRFDQDRLQYIEGAECKGFYSQLKDWQHVNNYNQIRLQRNADLDNKNYDHSNNSPFVACVLAYKLGATEIVTYGVDFTQDHKYFKHKNARNAAIRNFAQLHKKLKNKGVNLYIGDSFSKLSEVIPLHTMKKQLK